MTRRRFSSTALMARLLSFDGKCAACGCKTGGANGLEWDHIIPLKLGGEDTLENLQPLCKACHKPKTAEDLKHIAKSKRMQQRQAGIPRQSRSSFKTNRDGPLKKKITGEVIRR